MVSLHKLFRIGLAFRLGLAVVGLAAIGSASLAKSGSAQTPDPSLLGLEPMWDFFRREAEDRRAGGNGGPRVPGQCEITIANHQLVWDRNPAFVWTGLQTIGLQRPAQASFWDKTATETSLDGVYRVVYSEDPLAPGLYEVVFSSPLLASNIVRSFEVMDNDTHAQIAAELEDLEDSLAAENADAETSALARADFFAGKNLASDALQELFTVAEPSPAMQQRQAEVVEMFCSDEQP